MVSCRVSLVVDTVTVLFFIRAHNPIFVPIPPRKPRPGLPRVCRRERAEGAPRNHSTVSGISSMCFANYSKLVLLIAHTTNFLEQRRSFLLISHHGNNERRRNNISPHTIHATNAVSRHILLEGVLAGYDEWVRHQPTATSAGRERQNKSWSWRERERLCNWLDFPKKHCLPGQKKSATLHHLSMRIVFAAAATINC